MRALGYGLAAVGLGMVGLGVYRLVGAAGEDVYAEQIGGYTMGGGFVLTGVILLFVSRRLWGLAPATVHNGVAGTAQVLSVHDTGITTNNTVMHVEAQVTASAPGIAAFPARVRVKLPRTQWGAIQPGLTIPVLIDSGDHSKVAYDYSRPAQAGVPGPMPGGIGGQHVVTRSAADLIAQGVPTMGTLFSSQPSGVTAGQAAAGLPAEQADDPLVAVSFGFPGPDGHQRTVNALVRLPDGKQLVPGQPVPVSYLADQPDTATIDWSRL